MLKILKLAPLSPKGAGHLYLTSYSAQQFYLQLHIWADFSFQLETRVIIMF